MATKIRLQRHGRKKKPFYWIVVANSRAKRDGKYIQKIGHYNPITNPAEIELDRDAAVKWLNNGAEPTETARRILSYKGALLQHHLEIGVRKGALSQEQAENKLNAWLEDKENKLKGKVNQLVKDKETSRDKKIQAEKAYKAEKEAARTAAAEPPPAEQTPTETPEAPPQENTDNA